MQIPKSISLRLTPPVVLPLAPTPSNDPQESLGVLPSESPGTQEHGEGAIANDQNVELGQIQPSTPSNPAREAESLLEPLPLQNESVTPDPTANTCISPLETLDSSGQVIPPAAKRRRVEAAHQDGVSVDARTQSDVAFPAPSEARDGVGPVVYDNTESGSFTPRPEITQQTIKKGKPRLSEKAKGKQPVKRMTVENATEAVAGSSDGVQRTKESKRPAAKRRRQAVEDVAANVVAHAVEGSPTTKKTRRGRKPREATPEGAEMVKITPSKVKMSDLCRNLRTGKKSTREKELAELEKAEALRKSQQQLHEVLAVIDTNTAEHTSEGAESRLDRLSRAGEESARLVPNTIIVDGEIHIDETSLQIDRHANAAIERDAEAQEGIDESELTRRVNSGSWLKRDRGGRWNEESTERFFEALRMFGTNFDMISKLFPGRTRHSIKLKFLKEEKADQERIKQTLMGERILVDMDEYSRITNTVYADPEELEHDLAEDRKRMEEEQRAAKEALDEAARQREREVEAERAAAEGEEEEKSRAIDKKTAAESEGVRRKRSEKAKVLKKTARARGQKRPSEVSVSARGESKPG